ncbi:ATP-binding protein, partial [Desulfurivibrio sp. C05AmB]|uniref:ATP-binding protein n=1 Tax=Desulfurivibrio sp. C05AmB TaxID=3374371 RepID=UPI00376F2C3D
MIPRTAAALARELAGQFKVVAIIGPRQSGKTTMARAVFSSLPYVSLEAPDERDLAQADPRGFLARFPAGGVIDEAQRCPDIFSYIQGIVDAKKQPGQFILTGSQHFGLMQGLTQSLAGRIGFVQLLPFSAGELAAAGLLAAERETSLLRGGYPPIYDQPVDPARWLDAYITTYVERDVRQLLNVRDLGAFQLFTRLCAGSTGQLLNLSRIGTEVGIDQKTARAWLGVLESSFIVFRLQPHWQNFRKRITKAPKLYFYDSGLAARLLGIEEERQLLTHPLKGALFETWVVAELLKNLANRGRKNNLYFWRSHDGHEIDILAEKGTGLLPLEIKSGATLVDEWFKPLE